MTKILQSISVILIISALIFGTITYKNAPDNRYKQADTIREVEKQPNKENELITDNNINVYELEEELAEKEKRIWQLEKELEEERAMHKGDVDDLINQIEEEFGIDIRKDD